MKYNIIEKKEYTNGEVNEEVVGTYNTEDEATNAFHNRVTAFLEGNDDEEPTDMYECPFEFWYEYEDGEEYTLTIKEVA